MRRFASRHRVTVLCWMLVAAGLVAAAAAITVASADRPVSSQLALSGGAIVFERERLGVQDIFAANTDATALRNVTARFGPLAYGPRWSPDGTHIAFVSEASDEGLYVADPAGAKIRRVAPGVGLGGFSWSPDAQKLVFSKSIESPTTFWVWVVNADGSGLRRLTDGFSPSWSPDGRTIAFFRRGSRDGLYAVAPDGTGEHLVAATDFDAATPAWSPDSRRIAFEGESHSVVVVDARGGQPVSVSGSVMSFGGVEWSPGSEVVFCGFRLYGREPGIYTAAPGITLRRLTGAGGVPAQAPSWSPHGAAILYGWSRDARLSSQACVVDEYEFWHMKADGSGKQRLPGGLVGSGVRWAPATLQPSPPGPRTPNQIEIGNQAVLSAVGRQVVISVGGHLPALWRPGAADVQSLSSTSNCQEYVVDVLLTRQRATWLCGPDFARLVSASLSDKRPRLIAAAEGDFRESPAGDYLGLLDGDGSLIAFAGWHENERGITTRSRIWGFDGNRRRLLVTLPGPIRGLSVDAGRIAVRSGGGVVLVLSGTGRRLGSLRVSGQGVWLDGRVVAVLSGGSVRLFDLDSGRAIKTVGLRGRPPFHVEDMEDGRIAYESAGEIHVRNLDTGRERAFPVLRGNCTTDAALTTAGLFYAHGCFSPWRGALVFVPGY